MTPKSPSLRAQEQWLERFSANTARAYQAALADWAAYLEDTIEEATPALAAGWASSLDRRYSAATARARIAAARSYHDYLIEQGMASENPFAGVGAPPAIAHPQALTLPQLRRLLAHLAPDSEDLEEPTARRQRDRALVFLLLHTGRRPAEVAGLRWEALEPADGPGWLLRWARRQAQPLPDICYELLAGWYKAAGWRVEPEAYLWRRLQIEQVANLPAGRPVSPTGPISPAQVGAILRRIGRSAGLPLSASTLRATFAALYSANFGEGAELIRSLGHTRPASTTRYLRTLRPAIDDYAAALAAVAS